jgi:glyoxylase-like metal-dependent hydrolase (beta-lactamase superfamily II)
MHRWVTDRIVVDENEHGSNITCIALEDELAFIDAGMLHGYTARFREAMESHYGLKASKLYITHAHIDHILAMNVFSDCEIIAATVAKPRFDAHMRTVFEEERLLRMESVFSHIREGVRDGGFVEPSTWVDSKHTEQGLVFNVHGGHSACSSSIYIPDEKCVSLGDLVQSERPPYFGEPDTDIPAWISTLDAWSESGITHVLPGHGPPVSSDYLRKVSGYFKDLTESLRQLMSENVPEDKVHLSETLPAGYWPEGVLKKPAHHYSVRLLYRSL